MMRAKTHTTMRLHSHLVSYTPLCIHCKHKHVYKLTAVFNIIFCFSFPHHAVTVAFDFKDSLFAAAAKSNSVLKVKVLKKSEEFLLFSHRPVKILFFGNLLMMSKILANETFANKISANKV